MESGTERARPDERFASDIQQFDLSETARSLEAEANPGQRGHKQIALYKQDCVTIGLFSFEPGGVIPTHSAAGTVMIQSIEGTLDVGIDGEQKEVGPGGLLVLAPEVPHEVRARDKAVMLLTVSLRQS